MSLNNLTQNGETTDKNRGKKGMMKHVQEMN